MLQIAFQTFRNDVAQRFRYRRIKFRRRHRAFLIPPQQAGHRRVRFVRRLAHQQFVENQSHRENVATLVQRLPHRLFRRHVLDRTQQRARLRHPVATHRARQPEIHHQDPARLRFLHDVLWLQIAVNDADAMRRIQCQANLANNLHGLRNGKLAVVGQYPPQVVALDELHRDELHAIRFGNIVDADYVLVCDLVRSQQFLLESRQNRRIRRQLWPNQLQRDCPLHFPVQRLVHRAHSTFAQQRQNLVTRSDQVARLQNRFLHINPGKRTRTAAGSRRRRQAIGNRSVGVLRRYSRRRSGGRRRFRRIGDCRIRVCGRGRRRYSCFEGFAGGGVGATRDAGLTGAGGVIGTSEMVAPSFGSNGTELSPFAGTPTPCGPPAPKLSRPPFFALGSSIRRHLPQVVTRTQCGIDPHQARLAKYIDLLTETQLFALRWSLPVTWRRQHQIARMVA